MKSKIDFDGYNTLLQPTEWRYAAATTGLVEYFKFNHISYGVLSELEEKPKESVLALTASFIIRRILQRKDTLTLPRTTLKMI